MRKTKESFFAAGHTIPKCINDGCEANAKLSNWAKWSFATECATCQKYRREDKEREGITRHKKAYCENHDGHLGFTCPIPRDGWIGWEASLQLDHIDGNHWNNQPENVETLCQLCHMRKSVSSGDLNSFKPSARR